MDLDKVWAVFIQQLQKEEDIQSVEKTQMAGIPFFYLTVLENIDHKQMQKLIEKAAVQAMKGKRLHSEMIFVRKEENVYVYRGRFFVPQEKMFCCGNLCHDCIRFRS